MPRSDWARSVTDVSISPHRLCRYRHRSSPPGQGIIERVYPPSAPIHDQGGAACRCIGCLGGYWPESSWSTRPITDRSTQGPHPVPSVGQLLGGGERMPPWGDHGTNQAKGVAGWPWAGSLAPSVHWGGQHHWAGMAIDRSPLGNHPPPTPWWVQPMPPHTPPSGPGWHLGGMPAVTPPMAVGR